MGGRKEPFVRNQPNEEGEPSKYAVRVQKQMRAEVDESVLSHSWTFEKKFPLHSIWSGGESQKSVIKTLCISNTWRFAWLLRKKHKCHWFQEAGDLGQKLHTFVHTQGYFKITQLLQKPYCQTYSSVRGDETTQP